MESRAQRAEQDATANVTAAIETRDDVRWLARAAQALLDHACVAIEPDHLSE